MYTVASTLKSNTKTQTDKICKIDAALVKILIHLSGEKKKLKQSPIEIQVHKQQWSNTHPCGQRQATEEEVVKNPPHKSASSSTPRRVDNPPTRPPRPPNSSLTKPREKNDLPRTLKKASGTEAETGDAQKNTKRNTPIVQHRDLQWTTLHTASTREPGATAQTMMTMKKAVVPPFHSSMNVPSSGTAQGVRRRTAAARICQMLKIKKS